MGFYRKSSLIRYIYKYNDDIIGLSNMFFLPFGYINDRYNTYKIVKLNFIPLIIAMSIIFSFLFNSISTEAIYIIFIGGIVLNCLCSFFIPNSKYVENDNYFYFLKKAFHNNITFSYNNEPYEIYSHGNNYFSIVKNEIQIALVKADDYIIMGEQKIKCSYLSEYIEKQFLLMLLMYIDRTYLKEIIGIKYCSMFHKFFTFNFKDKHKERLLFIGDANL